MTPLAEDDTLTVTLKASDLLKMTRGIIGLLGTDSFSRATNIASAAAANLGQIRMLGEHAGRARHRQGSKLEDTAVDADIANYVLDEFASIRQLEAANVVAVKATEDPEDEDSKEGADLAPPHEGTDLQVKTVSDETGSTGHNRLAEGISAVDRLLVATGTFALSMVTQRTDMVRSYVSRIGKHLTPDAMLKASSFLGDVGSWELDLLEFEALVSFPEGLDSAQRGPARGVSPDAVSSTSVVPALSLSSDVHPRGPIGLPGSAGTDSLDGVRRLALPVLGMILLRRHGLFAATGASPRWAKVSPRIQAVSIDQGGEPSSASPSQPASAAPAPAVIQGLNIEEGTVAQCLIHLSDGYRSNPYHNATHAADVMYTAHTMLLSPHLVGVLKPEEKFAVLFGAALHDFRHDGLNNALHTRLKSPLAVTYNDISVLESMHLAESFRMMWNSPVTNVLGSLSGDQQRKIRESIVEIVLATDMRFHFAALQDFEVTVLPLVRSYLAKADEVISHARSQRLKSIVSPAEGGTSEQAFGGEETPPVDSRFDFKSSTTSRTPGRRARLSVVSAPVAELQAHSRVICKIITHASDISNPVKPLGTYRKWANRCMAEFFHAGDCERHAGLAVSTFYDRHARNTPKCQIGFITYIVRPLFAALSELITDRSETWKTTLDANQAYFDDKVKTGATDDDPLEGDWFDFHPETPIEGACIENPFSLWTSASLRD
jgi:hypothetical protein